MTPGDPRITPAFRLRLLGARLAVSFEALWPALWPAIAVLGLFLTVSLLDVWLILPGWLHGAGLGVFAVALAAALVHARHAFAIASIDRGLARLEKDSGTRHQPLRALGDHLPGELSDPVTRRLWEAHRERLIRQLGRLRLRPPRSGLPRRDPWALRAALLLVLVIAFVDAGDRAGARLLDAFRAGRAVAAATVPLAVKLWITPPAYTGKPPLGLDPQQQDAAAVPVPTGSALLVQVHHLSEAMSEPPQLVLDETPTPFASLGDGSAEAKLELTRSGVLAVKDGGGDEVASWRLEVVPDDPPTVAFDGAPAVTHRGVMRMGYIGEDDYGVAELALLMAPKDRPEEQERRTLVKPTSRPGKLQSAAYLDLTAHPLAGLPVELRLEAVDGIGQKGLSQPLDLVLPERVFTNPLAKAVIEQRKQLMAEPEQQRRVAARLRVLAETALAQQLGLAVPLTLGSAAARLDNATPGPEGKDARLSTAGVLWDLALFLEEGGLSTAERDLRAVQEQLQKALAEGADDAELERLMSELQQAMDKYLEEMARQAMQNGEQNQQQAQPMPQDRNQMVDRQDLQRMLDKAREMMRSGAKDAARQMLSQLQEMLENLQAMNGQQQASPQQQALGDLQKMIQLQRDLQERSFKMQRQGQNGQMSPRRGQPQEGQQGEPQAGQGEGQEMGQAAGEQEALRRALGELMRRLGEQGTEIPRALGQAEMEMRGARGALQQAAPGEAADAQGRAVDNMQQGGQALMEALAQQMGQQPGQQGQGQPRPANGRDPLGRAVQNDGGWDTNGDLVPEGSDLGRARGVLEELQRRAGDRRRPQTELDYYNRLLDRF
jgi:uncharacterized protein (TIGR02302 family)